MAIVLQSLIQLIRSLLFGSPSSRHSGHRFSLEAVFQLQLALLGIRIRWLRALIGLFFGWIEQTRQHR